MLQDKHGSTSDSPTTIAHVCRSQSRQCDNDFERSCLPSREVRCHAKILNSQLGNRQREKAERTLQHPGSTHGRSKHAEPLPTAGRQSPALSRYAHPHKGAALGSRAKVNGSSAQTSLADSGEDSGKRPATQLVSVRALLSHANCLQPHAVRT